MRPLVAGIFAGLGMGFTLKAALDDLPAGARVEVVELNTVIPYWCRGPMAILTDNALDDPRVELTFGDVAEKIRQAANGPVIFFIHIPRIKIMCYKIYLKVQNTMDGL